MEANDTALLLRAGSLAAPMEIIIGIHHWPQPGRRQYRARHQQRGVGHAGHRGLHVLYMLFGVFSSIAPGVNVLMLIAVLSMLQATLTLPGIAAMALALGGPLIPTMLINERIRRTATGLAADGDSYRLRTCLGHHFRFQRHHPDCWLAQLAFGFGSVRGLPVHAIGILASMFSAVFFSRAAWSTSGTAAKKLRMSGPGRSEADGMTRRNKGGLTMKI